MKIPVVVQHRHVHLSEQDQEQLFGKDADLASICSIGHRGQDVCDVTVSVAGNNGMIERVRVLGPCRAVTQVELPASDVFALGINAPVRVSGDLSRSGSCTLVGPEGEITLKSAVIIPARHLHCRPQDAKKLGIGHHDRIDLQIPDRGDIIEHVTVRVHPTFALEFHLSADEAAEHWIHSGDHVIVK